MLIVEAQSSILVGRQVTCTAPSASGQSEPRSTTKRHQINQLREQALGGISNAVLALFHYRVTAYIPAKQFFYTKFSVVFFFSPSANRAIAAR